MSNSKSPLLVWGCDPSRQFESAWLQALLGPVPMLEAWNSSLPIPADAHPVVLVESGLLRLERSPAPSRLAELHNQRQARINQLAIQGSFGLIHLSDEEGLDADSLYPILPPETVVWRNFAHPRLKQSRVFPIGPRADFIPIHDALTPCSSRPFPWAFMGTLWSSGSRSLAASLFLRALPQGCFHGGHRFAQGLPLSLYRHNLLASAFALCPEGDRHLDTFRLYESLQAGCIPVLVDQGEVAKSLLGDLAPFPVFSTWTEALNWVQGLLREPQCLDLTQRTVIEWWRLRRASLALAMRHTLLHDSVA